MAHEEKDIRFVDLFIPLTNLKAIFFIIIIGCLLYFSSLFNGFVGDDILIIINNPSFHSLANIPSLVLQGNVHDESNQLNNFYRPVVSVAYTLIYSISGQNPFGYHVFLIVFHMINTMILYYLFTYFFRKWISFISALLFLIHPINTEVVAYISALLETLFLFFGLLALNLTMYKPNKKYSFILIPIFLLLSLLSKETGVVFFLLVPLFAFLYEKKQVTKSILYGCAAFFVYLFLRLAVARIPFGNVYTMIIVPIQTLPLSLRLLNMPSIIFYYIKTFFFPLNLIAFQSWILTDITIQNFYLPFIADLTFFLSLFIGGVVLWKNKSFYVKPFIFFFAWFILGLLVHAQIIPLDETVSDRWFYLPIAGLLGIIAVSVSSIKIQPRIVLLVAVIILTLFSIRTEIRIGNWKNDGTLATHDISLSPHSFQLERMLGNSFYSENNFSLAEMHFIKSTQIFPSELTFSGLGNYYLKTKQPKKAIIAFTKSLAFNPTLATSWAFLAVAKNDSGDNIGAINAAKKAYAISPTTLYFQILDAISKKETVELY